MTRTVRHHAKIVATTCVGLALLAACSSSGGSGNATSAANTVPTTTTTSASTTTGGSAAASGAPYQWGVTAELSGVVSFYGASILQGVQAYVDQVNAAGGINGHPIKLTSLDNAGDQSRAATTATQLVTSDKVDAVLGNTLSSDCTAAQPIVERNKVPMACLSVDSPSPWVYNLGPDNTQAAGAMLSAAKKVANKSNPTAAFVYINTLTDISLSKTIAKDASGAGVNLATSQQVDLTATDVSGQVAKVVAAKPDVVLITDTGPGMLAILKGVRAAGITAPFVWLDGTSNMASLATSTDKNVYAFNSYTLIQPGATDAAAKSFITAITPKIKDAKSVDGLNSGEAVSGYATAMAWGAALKSCGYPCSGEQLKAQLDKLDVAEPGILPHLVYSASDHYPWKNWYLYHVVGPKATLTATFPAAKS